MNCTSNVRASTFAETVFPFTVIETIAISSSRVLALVANLVFHSQIQGARSKIERPATFEVVQTECEPGILLGQEPSN